MICMILTVTSRIFIIYVILAWNSGFHELRKSQMEFYDFHVVCDPGVEFYDFHDFLDSREDE